MLWDKDQKSSVKGLCLRFRVNSTSWYLIYRNKQGVNRGPKLGDYPEMSLNQARDLGRQMKWDIAQGLDPSLERQKLRQEKTLNDLFETVYETHYLKPKFIESGWAKEVKRLYETNLKDTFGSHKLSTITAEEVRKWFSHYENQREVEGNRSRSVLSKLFSLGIEKGDLPQGSNPVNLVKKYEEEVRDRVATPSEIQKIHEILVREQESHPLETTFLLLLLYTGARPRALERMRWDQLEEVQINGEFFGVLRFNRKTVRGKTKQEILHVPPQGLRLIKNLPKLSGLILNIPFPKSFWNKVRQEVGCQDLWGRDFRRTFGSIGLSHGEDLGVISELLNHKEIQTTKKIYARAMESTRFRAVGSIAHTMEGIMNGKNSFG